MELNKIYNENCIETMRRMPENFIDLTVTSPPYDNLRKYNGYTFDFEIIAGELFRVTKIGGVVVWIVNDATINGSETGTSFRQALHFMDIGFNLHDTMIWAKNQLAFPDKNRYYNGFEYMFILSKGAPKTLNLIADKINKSAGRTTCLSERNKDGSTKKVLNQKKVKEYSIRFNIWEITNASRGIHSEHPATFPEQLAKDHIYSWSNKGELVYDPFMGSGTTAKASMLLGRNYIGSEISAEYCNLIEKRLSAVNPILDLDF